MSEDIYAEVGYGGRNVGFGEWPGIVVVDFARVNTDAEHPFARNPRILSALRNTAKLLDVARRCNVPVANCYTAHSSRREMPHWKITTMDETFFHGHPYTELDPRIYDPNYDVKICKTGPSIFFQTPVIPFFIKERVDTVIITGCCTSGCIRASTNDAFQLGFRTIIPEECVGDQDEQPHLDNLRDVSRRYADVVTLEETIAYIENIRKRNQ